jgi:hypothetical protein
MSEMGKPGITRAEHNESALPQAADIELTLQEVCVAPAPDIKQRSSGAPSRPQRRSDRFALLELQPGYTIGVMCAAIDLHNSVAEPASEALRMAGLPP